MVGQCPAESEFCRALLRKKQLENSLTVAVLLTGSLVAAYAVPAAAGALAVLEDKKRTVSLCT